MAQAVPFRNGAFAAMAATGSAPARFFSCPETSRVASWARTGPAAVVGLAVYILGRQVILGLRAEARAWRHGRAVTGAAAVLALVAGLVLLIHQ